MFLKSGNTTHVSSCNNRPVKSSVYTDRISRGFMLVGLIIFQGVVYAQPSKCRDIPPYIVVQNDTYECDVFDVSNVDVEALGASFISAEVFTKTSAVDSGYIRLAPGFTVIDGASFSASFVPDATYFTCAGSCHSW